MKRNRLGDEQMVEILRQHEAGAKPADLCRQNRISGATLYNWRRRYGGLQVSDAKHLRSLEEENRKLKKLLAEAMLDNAAAKDIASRPGGRRSQSLDARGPAPRVDHVQRVNGRSQRRACGLIGMDVSSYRHRSRPADDGPLRERLGNPVVDWTRGVQSLRSTATALDQSASDRLDGCFRARGNVELPVYILHITRDGVWRQSEHASGFADTQSAPEQSQHIHLPGRQRFVRHKVRSPPTGSNRGIDSGMTLFVGAAFDLYPSRDDRAN